MDTPAVKTIFFLLGAFAFVVLYVYGIWPILVFPMPGLVETSRFPTRRAVGKEHPPEISPL